MENNYLQTLKYGLAILLLHAGFFHGSSIVSGLMASDQPTERPPAERIGQMMLGLCVTVEPDTIEAYQPVTLSLVYTNKSPHLDRMVVEGAFRFGKVKPGIAVAVFDSHGRELLLPDVSEIESPPPTGCTIPKGEARSGRLSLPFTIVPTQPGKYYLIVTYQSGAGVGDRYVEDLVVQSNRVFFEIQRPEASRAELLGNLSKWKTFSEQQRTKVLNEALDVGEVDLMKQTIKYAAKAEPALVARVLQIVCDKRRATEIRLYAAQSLERVTVPDAECLVALAQAAKEDKSLRLEAIRLLSLVNSAIPDADRSRMLETLFQHFSKTKETACRLAAFNGLASASTLFQDQQLANFALSDADGNLRALALHWLLQRGGYRNSFDRAEEVAHKVSTDKTPLDRDLLRPYIDVKEATTFGAFAKNFIQLIKVLKAEQQQDPKY